MLRPVSSHRSLELLQQRVMACTRCPRLVDHREEVARQKRRMYRDWVYWGKPVPSFGDSEAQLVILGLAPAAHGANRTGRMFTGDRSGEFLYRALYEAGFANQPTSQNRGDGLALRDCYITAVIRCAPPANKPLPSEVRNCRSYLERELELLTRVRAVLALGRIAFDTYLRLISKRSAKLHSGMGRPFAALRAGSEGRLDDAQCKFPPRSSFRFAHGVSYFLPPGLPRLFASYHPSRQNTQTGRLTPEMMRKVLTDIRRFLDL